MKTHYLLMLLFACALSSCSKETVESIAIEEAENAVKVEQQILLLLNEHRSSLGFNELNFSDLAYAQANEHTDYMIAKGTANHDNFSVRASNISSAANATYVSENVAKDYDSGLEAFQQWLASSDHRMTMEGEFTHTAVSVKRNGQGKLYFTHLFYR
ncbi:CAP domain-containing protein [Arenibacter sp. H213]|uniref:CAP domain-containing protein n=1 Tax=Arenibacter antarcticus TaxID=2040469 RepID=A0ABW5VIP8_9FLAO|nr:CAP domain-containing protein [Arenibacter sp. H213]MCM4166683.1 CAP domain-containing protein [Arenibacter sp. H213]